jgi:hypothetical protein
MSRFQTLQNAVQCLDDSIDSHWLDDGRPDPRAVQKIAGEGIDSIDGDGAELNKFGRRRRDVVTAKEIASASKPRPAPSPKAVEDAQAIVLTAAAGLDAAREAQSDADRRVRGARQNLAAELQAWQQAHPPQSDAEMRREFIASNQATLQAIKDGTQEAPRGPVAANSVIDRFCVATAHTYGQSAGGGQAFRRGASIRRGMRLPSQR